MSSSSPNKFTENRSNCFKGIYVKENEKDRIMNILGQFEDFQNPNNSLKCVQQLKNNNFLFAINFMNTCYTIQNEPNPNISLCKISETIRKLIYCFDLFTHIQLSNQDNLNLFDILNDDQRDQKLHRFKKKFVTFQHKNRYKDKEDDPFEKNIGKSNNVLVSFNALLEYFIDNVQQNQLFNFFPQLCSAALNANINLYLYASGKLIKKEFSNKIKSISECFVDASTRDILQCELLLAAEKEMSVNKQKERPSFHIAVLCDENYKNLKYFALFPEDLNKVNTSSILEYLTGDWTQYYTNSSYNRFNQLYSYFERLEDLTFFKLFEGLISINLNRNYTMYSRYAISKKNF
jgi:hypothetical protein